MSGTDIFSEVPEFDYQETLVNGSPEEFEKVVYSRRSIRVYEESPVPDEVIKKCIDIAIAAPSSSNLQPWEFYRVKSPDKKKELVKYCVSQPAARTASELIVCVARRDTWKKHAQQMIDMFDSSDKKVPQSAYDYYQKLMPIAMTQGPLGIIGLIKKMAIFIIGLFRVIPREPNSTADMRVWAHKSTALACQNLMLAFRAYGYDTCPMEGMDSKRVRKLLELPRKAEICMVISVGKRKPEGVYGPRIRFNREQFYHEV